jgi:hypothetical protein
MKNAIQVVIWVIVFLGVIDVFGFGLWVISGQTPNDDLYLGTITSHTLKALMNK